MWQQKYFIYDIVMYKWRWKLIVEEIFTDFNSVLCIRIRRTSVVRTNLYFPRGYVLPVFYCTFDLHMTNSKVVCFLLYLIPLVKFYSICLLF